MYGKIQIKMVSRIQLKKGISGVTATLKNENGEVLQTTKNR